MENIESEGSEAWLGKLTQELQQKTYKADPLRRVWLDKPDGTQRPLGIPTIRDRVVMTAAVLVLAPIFEPDLQPEQYAYRKGRNAHDAVKHVHSLVNSGHTEVVDADLSGYFDTIPFSTPDGSLTSGIGYRSPCRIWDFLAVAERGYSTIRLDVIDTNPRARRLYERLGFVATKTERFEFLRWLLGFGASTTMIYSLQDNVPRRSSISSVHENLDD